MYKKTFVKIVHIVYILMACIICFPYIPIFSLCHDHPPFYRAVNVPGDVNGSSYLNQNSCNPTKK